MAIVPKGQIDLTKIKAAVRRAEQALARDGVVRIMYSYGVDVEEEYSLFFRVLLTDAASAPDKLRQTTQKIETRTLAEIRASELGLQTYFNFRSQSEQAKLREPAWEL